MHLQIDTYRNIQRHQRADPFRQRSLIELIMMRMTTIWIELRPMTSKQNSKQKLLERLVFMSPDIQDALSLRGCIITDQIIHVGFCFGELHLVHSLPCVPMQECLAAEHGCEILSDTLEHLLDCCGIPQEGHCHLQTLR